MGQETRDHREKGVEKREYASGKTLADAIRARFGPLGGVELELPPRQPIRDRCLFGETSREPLDTRR